MAGQSTSIPSASYECYHPNPGSTGYANTVIPLILNIVFAVIFGHIMKLAGHRKSNLLWVGAFNYLCASTISALVMIWARPTHAVAFTAITGAWGGVCYLVSLLYYFAAVARLGMGLATSANRISVALPVAVAIVFWHEQLQPIQLAGIIMVVVALPLLGGGRLDAEPGGSKLLAGVLLPLFVVTGLGQLAARIYSGAAPADNAFLFQATLFGAAAITALLTLTVRPVRATRQDLVLGVLLGCVNLLTNIFLLTALRDLPSAIVFSVSSAGSVLLAAITGILIWKERPTSTAGAGVLLATMAVVALTR